MRKTHLYEHHGRIQMLGLTWQWTSNNMNQTTCGEGIRVLLFDVLSVTKAIKRLEHSVLSTILFLDKFVHCFNYLVQFTEILFTENLKILLIRNLALGFYNGTYMRANFFELRLECEDVFKKFVCEQWARAMTSATAKTSKDLEKFFDK